MIHKAPSIADYDSSTLHFGVTSEIFPSLTRSDDGTQMEGVVVFISATTEDGVVFVRQVGISDWKWSDVDDEFGEPFMMRDGEHPTELNEKAGYMLTKLQTKTAPRLNPAAWHFYRAVYGSKAYVDLDMESHYAAEERAEYGF